MLRKSVKKQIPESIVVISNLFIGMVVKWINNHNIPDVFHMDTQQAQHNKLILKFPMLIRKFLKRKSINTLTWKFCAFSPNTKNHTIRVHKKTIF